MDDFGDNGAQGAEVRLVLIGINLDELGEVAVNTLPEGRFSWIASAIKLQPSGPVFVLTFPL